MASTTGWLSCIAVVFSLIGVTESQVIADKDTLCPPCENGGECDPETLVCICPAPYVGRTCGEAYCAKTPPLRGATYSYDKVSGVTNEIVLSCDKSRRLYVDGRPELSRINLYCANNAWEPIDPSINLNSVSCKRLTCPSLAIADGQAIPRGYEDMEFQFACKPGFRSSQINGTVIAECIEGEWMVGGLDLQDVECLPTTCNTLPSVSTMTSFLVSYCSAMCPETPEEEEASKKYEVVCNPGYRLPESGNTRSSLYCENDIWVIEDEKNLLTNENAMCIPHCGTPCQNGGTCIGPSQCACTNLWKGDFCEIATCAGDLPKVENGEIYIGARGPVVICNPGYNLGAFKTASLLICVNQLWTVDGEYVPEGCSLIPANNETACGSDKEDFPNVNNAVVLMNDRGVITASCYSGFYFEANYEREIALVCEDEDITWTSYNKENIEIGCVEQCQVTCENGGKCMGNNMCRCLSGYSGKRCEIPNCSEFPMNQNAAVNIQDLMAYGTCKEGYQFPDGSTSTTLICTDGSWTYPIMFQKSQRIQCDPICEVPCQNGGWCYKPNRCKCTANFNGDFCESQTRCLDFIPGVPFTRITRLSDKRNAATCKDGYKSNGDGNIVDVECAAGVWSSIDSVEIADVLKCLPVCSLPCKNGGVCLGPNTCKCPPEFVGLQCETFQPDGGCALDPPYVPNGLLAYRIEGGVLQCDDGYHLPRYENELKMTCSRGRWIFDDYITLPYGEFCVPICSIPCQNGGQCSASETCSCPSNYKGVYCQTYIEEPCRDLPSASPNSFLSLGDDRSSQSTGHFIVCAKGYAFQNGRTRDEIECVDGQWKFPTMYDEEQTCQPVCTLPCLNGGICVAPETCMCAEPYNGRSCENLKKQLCWQKPQNIDNAIFWYSPVTSTAICEDGYILPNGNNGLNFTCNDGIWDTDDSSFEFMDSCLPECEIPCRNGGICTSPNICTCKEGFTGSSCQTYEGLDCETLPDGVAHGTFYYSQVERVATLKCDKDYMLKSSSVQVTFKCTTDQWIDELDGTPYSDDVRCLPICERPCQNYGFCIAPNVCECPYDFIGAVCQYKRCKVDPPHIRNADLIFSDDSLEASFRCFPLHRLPWGATGLLYKCINGNWALKDKSIQDLGEQDYCRPICDRPCMNGGWCESSKNCKCAQGFFGDQCEKRYETTIKGDKCQFPFTYDGIWYYGCVDKDYHRPWCATDTNIHGLITAWDVCVADLGTTRVVVTEDMLICEFPFTYKSIAYNSCTSTDREKLWCATKTNGRNAVVNWGYCDLTWGSSVSLITTTGHECLPKFDHYGQVITGCVDEPLKPWCSIKVKNSENQEIINDVCLADWGSYHVSLTVTGKVCKFPFKHMGHNQWTCVPANGTVKSWCATKVDINRVVLETGECPPYHSVHQQNRHPSLTTLFPSLGFTNIFIQTITGYECSLPFIYKGKQINGCTYLDSEEPWCAIEVDQDGNALDRDICPPNWDIRDKPPHIETPCDDETENLQTIITELSKLPCVMPFRFRGKEIYGCTSERGERAWCATKVDELLTPIITDICPEHWDLLIKKPFSVLTQISIQTHQENYTLTTIDGQPCIFPFNYKDQTYSECIYEDSIKAWCPTAVDSHGFPIDWGYCQENWEYILQELSRVPEESEEDDCGKEEEVEDDDDAEYINANYNYVVNDILTNQKLTNDTILNHNMPKEEKPVVIGHHYHSDYVKLPSSIPQKELKDIVHKDYIHELLPNDMLSAERIDTQRAETRNMESESTDTLLVGDPLYDYNAISNGQNGDYIHDQVSSADNPDMDIFISAVNDNLRQPDYQTNPNGDNIQEVVAIQNENIYEDQINHQEYDSYSEPLNNAEQEAIMYQNPDIYSEVQHNYDEYENEIIHNNRDMYQDALTNQNYDMYQQNLNPISYQENTNYQNFDIYPQQNPNHVPLQENIYQQPIKNKNPNVYQVNGENYGIYPQNMKIQHDNTLNNQYPNIYQDQGLNPSNIQNQRMNVVNGLHSQPEISTNYEMHPGNVGNNVRYPVHGAQDTRTSYNHELNGNHFAPNLGGKQINNVEPFRQHHVDRVLHFQEPENSNRFQYNNNAQHYGMPSEQVLDYNHEQSIGLKEDPLYNRNSQYSEYIQPYNGQVHHVDKKDVNQKNELHSQNRGWGYSNPKYEHKRESGLISRNSHLNNDVYAKREAMQLEKELKSAHSEISSPNYQSGRMNGQFQTQYVQGYPSYRRSPRFRRKIDNDQLDAEYYDAIEEAFLNPIEDNEIKM